MRKLLFIFMLSVVSLQAQQMNNQKLAHLIHKNSDSVFASRSGYWHFSKADVQLVCVTDSTANRMRIISPIVKTKQLNEELLRNALIANFHTALDVKYAISDAILWSVFIHPLKELSKLQVVDAIGQVLNANLTFGTTYQSTEMIFNPSIKEEASEKVEEESVPNPQQQI